MAHSQTSIVRLHRYLLDWDYVSQRRVCVYRLPGLCPTLDKHTQNNSNIYTSKTVITSVLNSSVASSMYSYLTVKCLQKLAPFLVKFALTHRKCSPEQVWYFLLLLLQWCSPDVANTGISTITPPLLQVSHALLEGTRLQWGRWFFFE